MEGARFKYLAENTNTNSTGPKPRAQTRDRKVVAEVGMFEPRRKIS